MACPFFLPMSRISRLVAESASLGDLYGGECAADRAASIPVDTLRHCCNEGYARSLCARAAESESDAIRFLVKARHDQAVEIAWAMERNHHPVAVGTLTVNAAAGANTPLDRQARAYAAALFGQNDF